MNTPDAGRIRVRWYKLPPDQARIPGTYELTDYSSSNFDTDPKSYDPPLGEVSTARDPFADWRDCCPPPWPGHEEDLCPLAQTATFRQYRIPSFPFTCRFGSFVFPESVATNTGFCLWTTGSIDLGPIRVIFRRTVTTANRLGWVLLVTRPSAPQGDASDYQPDAYTDWTAPFVVRLERSFPHMADSPETIRLTPIPPRVLGVDRCFGIGTEAGDFILVA